MTNAFLAALLKVAAEERQHEERLRVLAEDFDRNGIALQWVVNSIHDEATEHAGRAEVYERFAQRLIADVASDLIQAEFQKLNGEAALLSPSREIPFEFKMDDWALPPSSRINWSWPVSSIIMPREPYTWLFPGSTS